MQKQINSKYSYKYNSIVISSMNKTIYIKSKIKIVLNFCKLLRDEKNIAFISYNKKVYNKIVFTTKIKYMLLYKYDKVLHELLFNT